MRGDFPQYSASLLRKRGPFSIHTSIGVSAFTRLVLIVNEIDHLLALVPAHFPILFQVFFGCNKGDGGAFAAWVLINYL